MSSRKQLVKNIREVLEADKRVQAAWLEGSLAREDSDELSDVDLWICVGDDDFKSFMKSREVFASKLGAVTSVLYPRALDQGDEIDSFQIILEDHPATLTIDVDVQKESRAFRFTEESEAEECHVLFDRAKIVQYKKFDTQEVEEYVYDYVQDTMTRFWHALPKTVVHIIRGDMLQAVESYMGLLEMYIGLLRVDHAPEKVDWGFKHVEYDLPEKLAKQVAGFIPSSKDKQLRKQLASLAKVTAKQCKSLGKRMNNVTVPTALIEQVLEEI